MPQVGFDIFFAEPGTTEQTKCRVCHAVCDVRRGVFGPTNLAESIGRKYRAHDVFVCPHTETGWHHEALRLAIAIEEMPSKRLAKLMNQDLTELLQANSAGEKEHGQ